MPQYSAKPESAAEKSKSLKKKLTMSLANPTSDIVTSSSDESASESEESDMDESEEDKEKEIPV